MPPAFLAVAFLLGLDDAAEAGSDRIDEHEVGEREPRGLVLDELRRHRRQRAVGREVDALRTDCAHVQVGRGRTRPAVEDERHGPRAVAVSGDVRDREDLRRGLLLLAQHRPLAGRRVLDRLAPSPPRGLGLGAGGWLVVGLLLVLLGVRVVAHGRARYRLHLRPRACQSGGRGRAFRVPRADRRRARARPEPLALGREVAPRDPALHRARVPVADAARALRRRVLRDPRDRPLPARDLRLQRRSAAVDVARRVLLLRRARHGPLSAVHARRRHPTTPRGSTSSTRSASRAASCS